MFQSPILNAPEIPFPFLSEPFFIFLYFFSQFAQKVKICNKKMINLLAANSTFFII